MQNRMKDIRFITLPEDRDMGSVTLSKDIPLPIQFPEGSVTDDIFFICSSVSAALAINISS